MGTYEQCRDRLQETLKTKQQVEAFLKEWGGEVVNHTQLDERTFVEKSIGHILDEARHKNTLDALGMKLGLESDAEYTRRHLIWASRRSWIAVAISGAALLVSVLVAMFK